MHVPQLYPSHRFHPDGRNVVVSSPADEALRTPPEDGWRDAEYPKPPKPPAVQPQAKPCPSCAGMKAKFDEAWKNAQDEIASLKDRLEAALKGSKKKPAAAPASTEPKPSESAS